MGPRLQVSKSAERERKENTGAHVQFGREICGDLAAAEAREWLVTNGMGGFASGTIAGTSISYSYNSATETLTLSGSDTLAHYQQVLQSVSFSAAGSVVVWL